MTRFRLITSWLLLLIPTLLLGVGALYLLKGEESRLEESARATARDRIAAIAGNIDLAIAEVKDGLVETMQALPPGNLEQQADLLEEWKRSNPLVRNVFVWAPGRGLLYPDPEMPATDEEAGFIRRYLPLFTNRAAWVELPMDRYPESTAQEQVSSILLDRKELRQLAKQAPATASAGQSYAAEEDESPLGSGGWRHWFADNRLHLIGWYDSGGGAQRIGVEVEMMALLSRLLGNFPVSPPYGETYALVDGNSNVFHQVGPVEIASQKPLARVSINELPHWQVSAYPNPESAVSESGFFLVSSLLVGIFVIAILFGGSLLLWQAHRNQRDARQKTSFVSNVSHELKTPLTTIRMYAEMLAEGKIKQEQKQHDYLQTIVRESQRLTRLVNNVLDFSRLEQGRKEFSQERIDLAALLHQLLDSQLVRLEEVGLQLSRKIGEVPVPIDCDRDAIEQIVLNLVDNAIKYAADGKKLVVELQSGSHSVVVRVRDNGPGIPAQHRQQVFAKFHRVDASLTTRKQGAGLGLSIARQLAEGVGGSLAFCPNAGGGSCFELSLPMGIN